MKKTFSFLASGPVLQTISCAEILPSTIHGLGLFATRKVSAGECICILDGQVIDWQEYTEITKKKPYGDFTSQLFLEWNALDQKTLLARPIRTYYSYINHSRSPNLNIIRYPLRVEAVRDIEKCTELTLDYRSEPLSTDYIKRANFL
jgi:SET domain-containing protein